MESDLDHDPFAQFERWFEEAKAAQPILPEGLMHFVASCLTNDITPRP